MRKGLLKLATVATLALTTASFAQDENYTVGVSIPAADHGWTSGVVFHANRVAESLMAQHPGLNIIVKTSPDAASQANANFAVAEGTHAASFVAVAVHSVHVCFDTEVGFQATAEVFSATQVDLAGRSTVVADTVDFVAFVVDGLVTSIEHAVDLDGRLSESTSGCQCSQSG